MAIFPTPSFTYKALSVYLAEQTTLQSPKRVLARTNNSTKAHSRDRVFKRELKNITVEELPI